MPKRSRTSHPKRQPEDPTDPILVAASIFEQVTGQPTKPPTKNQHPAREKNPAAVTLGKLGGAKGGKARAAKLSPRKRKAIAKKAARTRWDRVKKKSS